MRSDKPLISILMAVYRPNMDWLREQLASLEAQTYPNLRLYILDDATPGLSREELEKFASGCVRSFPVTVERSGTNLGSNAAFERLTASAEGEYFAYCDQDDIWLPGKLAVLHGALENTGALLACSDMTVIGAGGERTAESITEIRRHHAFRSGEGLWDALLEHNFVSGCAMLVRADEARRALPFNPHMVYDHYIALCCADRGKIVSLPGKLLQHREHGENQSTLLRGVGDRESYYRIRVTRRRLAAEWLLTHMDASPELRERLAAEYAWLKDREAYAAGDRARAGKVLSAGRRDLKTALWELAMPALPDAAVKGVLALARKNRF